MAAAHSAVLICLGRSAPCPAVERAERLLGEDGIRFGAWRTIASRRYQAMEYTLMSAAPIDWRSATKRLRAVQRESEVDLIVRPDHPKRGATRLLMLDMDSTLVQGEGIDELAKEAGVGEAVTAITRRAMNGELDFPVALRERVGLLRGLPVTALERVAERTTLSPGAQTLISVLRESRCVVAVVSGGFDYFTARLQTRLKLDYTFANRLDVADGRLTGRLVGDIVDGRKKAELLADVARKENVPLAETLAIGDGANDLLMLDRAGLGVAYRAKPAVREAAPATISHGDLAGTLLLLGYTESDLPGDGDGDRS